MLEADALCVSEDGAHYFVECCYLNFFLPGNVSGAVPLAVA